MDSRDAVLELILELLAEDEFRAGPSAGLVLQGYLRDSPQTLDTILDWLRPRRARAAADDPARQGRLLGPRDRPGRPARLVRRRCSSVKADTDANFELLTRRLLDARPARARRDRLAQPALGRARDRLQPADRRRRRTTSSCRSCAASATRCRPRSPPRACACAPTARSATSWPGMAYLVRRLLENTSQRVASCTSRRAASPLEELLAQPRGLDRRMKPFANEPILELRRAPVRAQLAGALEAFDAEGRAAGAGLDRRRRARGRRRSSRPTPASPTASWPRRPSRADGRGRPRARRRARGRLGRAGRSERAEVLVARRAVAARAAARDRRARGARVREAVARGRRRRLRGDRLPRVLRARRRVDARRRALALLQLPGERNELRWTPRGVVAVISPWNFPVAIPLGMIAAGLATGNAVILKPAEQAPGCALVLVRALREAGVPPSALALLPGEGDVGAALVRRPARAHDRVHRLRTGRAGDRARAPPRRRPARSTSSASSPRWAARTA